MTVVASTCDVSVVQVEMPTVPLVWFTAEARVMASVKVGIEQLKNGQSTLLTDADLATDDDD